jgi:hypothetical protein
MQTDIISNEHQCKTNGRGRLGEGKSEEKENSVLVLACHYSVDTVSLRGSMGYYRCEDKSKQLT